MEGKKRQFKIRPFVLIASILAVMLVGTGVVMAWINATTDPVTNTFVPATVTCAVKENFDGNTKTDVSIQNTGNIDAFIRAMVNVTWVSETDTHEIYAVQPKADEDYTIEWDASMWFVGDDGYYYYKVAVHPGEQTQPFIKRVVQTDNAPEGYRLSVEIFATAIQSEPANVVADHWHVYNENGVLAPIN